MEERKLLDVSWATIFRILFVVVSFYLIFLVKEVLILTVFALIISVLFNPAIDFLIKRMVPRTLSVVFIYLSFFALLVLSIYAIIPLFVKEAKGLFEVLPRYLETVFPMLEVVGFEPVKSTQELTSTFYPSIEKAAGNVFSIIALIFGGLFSGFFVIATAFFFSLEKGLTERWLTILFPKKYEEYILNIWKRCEKKVAGWFATRIIACVFVGLASYIAFLIFNIEYPFSLGLLSGVLNFVPYIGPAIMGIFLFLIIFPIDPLKSLFVVITFILVQQIEGSILSPILTKKIIGLSPALVLISLVVGAKLWGVLGAILVIPLVAILFEFLKEFFIKKREEENAPLSL